MRSDDTPRMSLIQKQSALTVANMTTAQRHSGGRHSKGARQPILSRVLDPVADAVRTEADTRGMSVSDYVATILAREVGLPELAPALPAREELPISAA